MRRTQYTASSFPDHLRLEVIVSGNFGPRIWIVDFRLCTHRMSQIDRVFEERLENRLVGMGEIAMSRFAVKLPRWRQSIQDGKCCGLLDERIGLLSPVEFCGFKKVHRR
jgi:hypothetical protein